MEFPTDLHYGPEHEWSRLNDDGTVTVGITDYAQHELGDVIYVSLPPSGQQVQVGDAFAEVESGKTASDIYAPFSGEIIEANEALLEDPQLLNASPYGKGWIIRLRMRDPGEVAGLLDASAYRQRIAEP